MHVGRGTIAHCHGDNRRQFRTVRNTKNDKEEACFLSDCRSDSMILANHPRNMCSPNKDQQKKSITLTPKIFTKRVIESSQHQFPQYFEKIGTFRHHFPPLAPTPTPYDTTCRRTENKHQIARFRCLFPTGLQLRSKCLYIPTDKTLSLQTTFHIFFFHPSFSPFTPLITQIITVIPVTQITGIRKHNFLRGVL